MVVQRLTPEGMMQPAPYAHVAVATGSRQVHVAGQVARTSDGQPLAAGDLTGQVAHVLRAGARGLAAGGATYDDVVRLTFYVARWQPERMGDFMAGIEAVAEEVGLPMPMPPASLIGVTSLFEPDILVELEATAVLD